MQFLSHIPWRHSNSSLVTPRESHHEPWGKSISPEESQLILTFLRAGRLSPGLMRLSPGLMLECLLGYFTSVQHSSSLVSSIKKGNLLFLKEFHYRRRELNPVHSASKVSALSITPSKKWYWSGFEKTICIRSDRFAIAQGPKGIF